MYCWLLSRMGVPDWPCWTLVLSRYSATLPGVEDVAVVLLP